MKKIVSLLSALALVATSFVAMTTVASATTPEATLRYEITYDNADAPYAAGSTGAIEIYCDGLELISLDNMDTYFAGIDSVGITGQLPTDYITSKKLSVSSPALSGSTRNYADGKFSVQWGTTDYETFVYDMTKALVKVKFTIAKDLTAPVEVTFEGCNINVGHYNEDAELVGGVYYGQKGVTAQKELGVPALTVGPEVTQKTLTGITLSKTTETVAAETAVEFPTVTANYDDDTTEEVTATWTLNGETVTEFTTPAATDAEQEFVFTAAYEGKEATYTVVVAAKKVEYGAKESADKYYLSADNGATASAAIKAWDVVAPTVDGENTITVTFTADGVEKPFEFKHGVTGGADVEFLALLLNAPEGVTMTVPGMAN